MVVDCLGRKIQYDVGNTCSNSGLGGGIDLELEMVLITDTPISFSMGLKRIFPAPPTGVQSSALLLTDYGSSVLFFQLFNLRTWFPP